MLESVFDVADFFISKSKPKSDWAITHLKLQKLVYYAQAWHLALYNEKLIDAKFEAWVHGPVCPELYREYCHYGIDEIFILNKSVPKNLNDKTEKFLNAIWKVYGDKSGRYLETLTHDERPWKDARIGLSKDTKSNRVISESAMAEYYSSLKGSA
ncbi:DUF4065 domain-containing protein [Heliobacterium chlorum]|uniref:DUF4065 domain-containing protein n=1 Tax=Heliobacterium chlorum TaxID=2698 RepID=A0ABR7T636_HELCL|nr:type II toxin-antitoxin system antitoxin SocA domain-containing protein [Heliobacterium chlorum]MBC9786239.1 DUF4065 domain-containing protein [Heliobacterium chlorum]